MNVLKYFIIAIVGTIPALIIGAGFGITILWSLLFFDPYAGERDFGYKIKKAIKNRINCFKGIHNRCRKCSGCPYRCLCGKNHYYNACKKIIK